MNYYINNKCNKQILAFIYVLSFYTLIGKSLVTFFNKPMKLQDITATLPICKNIGMSFKNLKSSTEVESLKDIGVDDGWYLMKLWRNWI